MIISVDPGSKRAGIAVFEDFELSSAWLVKGENWFDTAREAMASLLHRYPAEVLRQLTLVIERPQIYPKNPVPPHDLVTIAMMVAALQGRLAPQNTIEYFPKKWKDQVPKEIKCDRIWENLSAEERSRVELPKNKKHRLDVLDAVGIGAYHLRLERI